MMIYLRHPDSARPTRRAVCETERTAQLRDTQGFQRCSAMYHLLLWQIDDNRAKERMAIERPWWY